LSDAPVVKGNNNTNMGGNTSCCRDGAQTFRPFTSNYHTVSQLHDALRSSGLKEHRMVLGIDFGEPKERDGRPLHCTRHLVPNPYQRALQLLSDSWWSHQEHITAFGFGDRLFSLELNRPATCETGGADLDGWRDIIQAYNRAAPTVSGNCEASRLTPMIRKAIELLKEDSNSYHILILITDGIFSDAREAAQALVEASQYPLSVVAIGVGKGPWEVMKEFDDKLPQRAFDNFNFVELESITSVSLDEVKAQFELRSWMEIPDQFTFIKENGMIHTEGLCS